VDSALLAVQGSSSRTVGLEDGLAHATPDGPRFALRDRKLRVLRRHLLIQGLKDALDGKTVGWIALISVPVFLICIVIAARKALAQVTP
jgi:hypothetical protein